VAESQPTQGSFAVVIVTHDSVGPLRTLLTDIAKSRYPDDGLAQIIVVDSGSERVDDLDFATTYGATVLKLPNYGFGASVNAGAMHVTSDYFVSLNPDVRVTVSALASLARAVKELGGFAVAPVLEDGAGIPIPLSVTPYVPLSRFWEKRPKPLVIVGSAITTRCVVGAAFAVDAAKFRLLGGFDTAFFLYSEEDDLILRAIRLGFTSYIDTRVSITHIGESSSENVTMTTRQAERIRGRTLYLRRHYTNADVVVFVVLELSKLVRRYGVLFVVRVVRVLIKNPRKGLPWPIANPAASRDVDQH
jgi:N-acetylglucosaminyl-diphospho-decaprenol L-rhamnosyltransferase